MTYFFAGGTSKTGVAVLNRLVPHLGAENICCLARPTSKIEPLQAMGVHIHKGDVTDPDSYKSCLGPDVIYIDMTHPKHYHISLETIVNARVKRGYFVTTTGIFSQYNSSSDIYKINEAKIKESGIIYTLLRPTMIYGSPEDKNMNKLINFLNRYPVFPLFGNGASLMQPVFVDDLADGIVAAIVKRNTEQQEYNLAGPEPISFREVVETIIKKLNRKVVKINISIPLGITLAHFAKVIPGFPITEEQIMRLQEDKVFDISKAQVELGYSPRSFDEGITAEIKAMALGQSLR
ncbi:NAD-dependent epimerase/dehydratase family protein [Ancylothrix sp. C2]|uniref:NAD-dependent epimerase/dehydratase family protein n=1 Tax=Ancylothrix sp. D3o TaxID=2953691 RepID=UPI0021BB7269|nr:NAD-dependent epimerase/dehydratase family protein [Ancylothrix sp. D3o]MCT7950031.1 NAD-dependent epimerase/dehydratase family protein [Ancylothrix sp. D3o]